MKKRNLIKPFNKIVNSSILEEYNDLWQSNIINTDESYEMETEMEILEKQLIRRNKIEKIYKQK